MTYIIRILRGHWRILRLEVIGSYLHFSRLILTGVSRTGMGKQKKTRETKEAEPSVAMWEKLKCY